MTETEKKLIHTANIQRAFVATFMQALQNEINYMIKFCQDNGIRIESFERRQLINIIKSIQYIVVDYKCLKAEKAENFKRYGKIMSLVVRQLFSKTDGDYMTMFKFYNYVKTFPTTCKEIEPTASEEQDAFSIIFNGDNSANS